MQLSVYTHSIRRRLAFPSRRDGSFPRLYNECETYNTVQGQCSSDNLSGIHHSSHIRTFHNKALLFVLDESGNDICP